MAELSWIAKLLRNLSKIVVTRNLAADKRGFTPIKIGLYFHAKMGAMGAVDNISIPEGRLPNTIAWMSRY